MVDFRVVVVVASSLCCAAHAAPPSAAWLVDSVRVATDTEVVIRPLQMVSVVLDVTMEGGPANAPIREVPECLSRTVTVNGVGYGARVRSVNAVAVFVMGRPPKTLPDGRTSTRVLALLYWNAEDEKYLFAQPGHYEIEFHGGATVKVTVAEPDSEERAIGAEMTELGLPFAMFMLEMGDPKAKDMVGRADEWLAAHPKTAYSEMLSVCVGLSKLQGLMRKYVGQGEFDPVAFQAERLALAERYFAPYCEGPIRSFHQVGAAHGLAEELLRGIRAAKRKPSPSFRQNRDRAVALLKKVRDSPYAVQLRAKTEAALRELGSE